MWTYKQWRQHRILKTFPIAEQDWWRVCTQWQPLNGLATDEYVRLRELTTLLLYEKVFEGVGNFTVTTSMRLTIALQACLPILNLGVDWYRDWTAIIIYPRCFVPIRTYADEAGIVHTRREPLCGESWLNGPVVLSWSDIKAEASLGQNLVIHEFAHKLDGRNGAVNGMPPLHRGMNSTDWTRDFSHAYRDLQARLAYGEALAIDPYAAEDPAEFFAVASELFFGSPVVLTENYPAVYGHLRDFYKQDPAARHEVW